MFLYFQTNTSHFKADCMLLKPLPNRLLAATPFPALIAHRYNSSFIAHRSSLRFIVHHSSFIVKKTIFAR